VALVPHPVEKRVGDPLSCECVRIQHPECPFISTGSYAHAQIFFIEAVVVGKGGYRRIDGLVYDVGATLCVRVNYPGVSQTFVQKSSRSDLMSDSVNNVL